MGGVQAHAKCNLKCVMYLFPKATDNILPNPFAKSQFSTNLALLIQPSPSPSPSLYPKALGLLLFISGTSRCNRLPILVLYSRCSPYPPPPPPPPDQRTAVTSSLTTAPKNAHLDVIRSHIWWHMTPSA